MTEFFTHSFETKIKNKMILELHEVEFLFYNGRRFYRVCYVTLEDNTFKVSVFKRKNDRWKCLTAFDVQKEPTITEAKFLVKQAIQF